MYVLYGVADRDPNEPVCMFFPTLTELRNFARELPGNYRTMTLGGVDFDALVILDA